MRLEVTSISLIHVKPVVLDVLDARVDAQRADSRTAAQVAVDAFNQEVLGWLLDSHALIAVTDFNIMGPDVLPRDVEAIRGADGCRSRRWCILGRHSNRMLSR